MVQQLDTCSLFNKLSEICLALIVNESLEIFAIIFINGNQFFFLTSSATSCSDVYNYVFILFPTLISIYIDTLWLHLKFVSKPVIFMQSSMRRNKGRMNEF